MKGRMRAVWRLQESYLRWMDSTSLESEGTVGEGGSDAADTVIGSSGDPYASAFFILSVEFLMLTKKEV